MLMLKHQQISYNYKQQQSSMEGEVKKEIIQCPYLGTIRRHLIDFDLEQACSVTLSNNNVYGCLICGRYFQGKGLSTPAYEHSIEFSHHVFINLNTSKIYSLPENYEVETHTLNDIKFNLRPTYSEQDLERLYRFEGKFNVDGKQYTPGIVGINNLKGTDYLNSIVQLLNTVKPFRQLFLLKNTFENTLLDKFGLLIKKLWNWQQFKGSICPYDIMQAITEKSDKLYRIGKHSDPANFLIWLIDNLQKGLKKQKINFNILQLFQGSIKTSYIKGIKNSAEYENLPTKVEAKTFTVIRLQFQEKGIFNKIQNHVDIKDLLAYYLGLKGKIQGEGLLYMKITQFPKYLVIIFKRFYSNDYSIEKDSSQVIYSGNLEIEGHKYKLIGQVCHQGTAQNGSYKAAVSFGERWFESEDLLINEVLKKQMLLGEPYIQLYERVN